MKKLLIVSPLYNGLYRYAEPLYEQLKKDLGSNILVKHIGNENMTFDIKEIEETANRLSDEIIKFSPDVIHYNYGTYDMEQIIPIFLSEKKFKCKQILTYHSLQLDLFKKINHEKYDRLSNEFVGKMDGYIFFTEYAREQFVERYNFTPIKNKIAFHPATHLDETVSKKQELKYDEMFKIDRTKPIATLLGYPSHWKDTLPIVKLVNKFPDVNFIIAGPWWKEKIIKENRNINLDELVNLIVINKELDIEEFNYMMSLGVGLFPYNYFKSFQGSGLLPNYLYRGINCVVNDIKPLKEYYSGCINMYDDNLLYKTFIDVINNPKVKEDKTYSYVEHSKRMIELYEEVK